MLFNSPISSEKADRLIDLLQLDSTSRVLDVGCGTGEFLMRIVERYGCHGVGVDTESTSLENARSAAEDRKCAGLIDFIQADIKDYDVGGSLDCGVCMGASHAYAMDEPAYPETLRGLGSKLKVGGRLLIGESYWTRPPEQEYLDFVGEPNGTYRTHEENVTLAESFGLLPLYAVTSSPDEWDDFEWSHHMRIENHALENPDDPEAIKKRDWGREWRAAYLKWGRGTLGFAFYLFRKES